MRFLVSIVLLLIAGCSLPTGEHEIRFALATAPINLDPRFATDATSERLNRLLYRRLVEFDDASRPLPGIASWDIISNRHYRLYLDENIPGFHHGVELTAKDVIATYSSVLDPATRSPHRGKLENIKAITLHEPGVIDFRLKNADNQFLSRLTLGILPADLLATGHDFHDKPAGNGEFRFVSRNLDSDILLQRVSDQQYFRFVEVRDPTVRLLKLVRGEVDMLQDDIAPELVDWLQQQDGLTINYRNGTNYTYLGFNLLSEKLKDDRVRRAIAHAIDRTSLLEHIYHDRARPAESLLAPGHWAGNDQLQPYAYDPELARQLLASAGWSTNRPLVLVYKTSTDPLRVRIATVISDQLSKVGVRVNVQSMDWGTFYGDIKSGNFEMYSLTWVGIRSPEIFEYIFHSRSVPPAGANRGHYVSREVDEMIASAAQGVDAKQVAADFSRIQQQLHHDLPYVPLWYEDHFVAVRNGISGYRLTGNGSFDGLHDVKATRFSTR